VSVHGEEERSLSEPEVGGRGTAVRVGVESGADEVRVEIPETLPVLPLKNTVLYPALLSPLLVNTARSKRLIDAVLVTPERLLIAPAVRRPIEGSPGPDDVYRVATVLRIVKMLKFPDDSYRLLVQGVARARIDIDMTRLLCLKAADMMDKVGTKTPSRKLP